MRLTRSKINILQFGSGKDQQETLRKDAYIFPNSGNYAFGFITHKGNIADSITIYALSTLKMFTILCIFDSLQNIVHI